jgi:hypothetical protein
MSSVGRELTMDSSNKKSSRSQGAGVNTDRISNIPYGKGKAIEKRETWVINRDTTEQREHWRDPSPDNSYIAVAASEA